MLFCVTAIKIKNKFLVFLSFVLLLAFDIITWEKRARNKFFHVFLHMKCEDSRCVTKKGPNCVWHYPNYF